MIIRRPYFPTTALSLARVSYNCTFSCMGALVKKKPTVKYLKSYNEVLFQGKGPMSEQI